MAIRTCSVQVDFLFKYLSAIKYMEEEPSGLKNGRMCVKVILIGSNSILILEDKETSSECSHLPEQMVSILLHGLHTHVNMILKNHPCLKKYVRRPKVRLQSLHLVNFCLGHSGGCQLPCGKLSYVKTYLHSKVLLRERRLQPTRNDVLSPTTLKYSLLPTEVQMRKGDDSL